MSHSGPMMMRMALRTLVELLDGGYVSSESEGGSNLGHLWDPRATLSEDRG